MKAWEKCIVAVPVLVAIATFIWVAFDSSIKQLAASQQPPASQFSALQPRCDSGDTVSTLMDLALRKFNDARNLDMVPNRGMAIKVERGGASYYGNLVPANLTVNSFRNRGTIGSGLACAALIAVHGTDDFYAVNTISVEYTIEPTTDGKTIVSARFRPNS